MENLIKISTTRTGKHVVNARQLHEYLESKRQFANWIDERISTYGFIEDQDYTSFNKIVKRETGATTLKEFAITLDMAKELCMVENNDQGKIARRYFIEAEKLLKLKSSNETLPSRKELALMVIEYEDRIVSLNTVVKTIEQRMLKAEEIVKEKEPLINYAETVQKTEDDILVRQLAKFLSNNCKIKIGQNRLFKWLRETGYLNKNNEPYQEFIDMGLFRYHETVITSTDHIFTRRTPTVTGKGRVYFIDKYIKYYGHE
jgi:anti-repressor protein